MDRDRYINGVTVVAVPLINSDGRLTHTLVGTGLSEQPDTHRVADMAKDMLHEASVPSKEILP